MPPDIALGTAIPIGFVTHYVLSIIYGVIFALILTAMPALLVSETRLVVAGTAFGIAQWIVNFLILPPIIGRPWFSMAPVIPQFIYHAFFWGTILGLFFARQATRAEHSDRGY